MTTAIKCNLTENAIDYLILAGEQAQQGSQRMAKHAIATLADGVELLLKARIELKDWSLIFKDIDKASKQSYESGDFLSVTFDQAVKRLHDICGVEISKAHLLVMGDLRQQRNRIRHFAISIDEEVAISLVAKTFSFALEFVTVHLQGSNEDIAAPLNKLRELLGSFEAFIQERFSQINNAIEGHYSRAFDCPVCLQTAFMIEGDKASCLFCGHHAEGELAASEWAERFLPSQSMKDDLIEPQIRKCPDCEMEACINVGNHIGSQPLFACFVCGVEGDYHDCPTCGELCKRDGVGGMCDNCCDHFLNKDD